ncbi:MAG TPA: TonB-dependent receptor [Bryobacteraceae bacterium]|nr:TonB-dependent receptor [Bryobacteraceae bacterium]
MHSLKWILASVFALTLSAAAAFAQTETGQITGTVLDPTGAAVPNATVAVKDLSTNAIRQVKSPDGTYVVPNLLAGRYEITASAEGFQTVKQTVTLAVGAKVGLDLHLAVGTQSTVVQVSENAVQINTETQTLGQNISGNEILALPTITRNPYDLVKTVGNVSDADPSAKTRGVGVAINGLRASDVSVLLDGVPNSNNFDTLVAIQTPLDSVGEVNVLTSNFTAEYGRAVAGVVNVDTKRGTNAFRGTAYEFNRVADLASNSFDNNANGIPKPEFVRNQFGFSAGGALIKDKLFVFGNPEWIRVRSSEIQTATVVTPQFLSLADPATQNFFATYGHLKSNLFPLQTFTRGQVCTTGACLNMPASTPVYQKVGYSVPADSGGGNPQNTVELAGRVDYNLSNSTQLYFRYARFDSNQFAGTVVNSPYIGYDTGEYDLKTSYAVSVTHVFSPTLVSQTKLSYNRIGILQPLGAAPVSPTLYTTLTSTNSLGNAQIVYPGYSPFSPGNAIPFGGPQNYIQINQDISKTMGKHSLRFGGLFTYLQDNRAFGAYEEAVEALGTNPASAFNGLLTGQLHDFQAAIYPQGKFPCSGAVQTPDCTLTLPVGPPDFTRSNRYHEAGLYAQDSWKVTPRLTLNLGLRWEYFGPQANGNPAKDSNWFYNKSAANIELATINSQVLLSTDPKNPVGGLWHRVWTNFGPRVGVAYDVFGNGKTSFRGGYGIGYEPNFGNVTFNVIQNPPNYAVVALTANTGGFGAIPITTNNSGPLAGSSGTKAFPSATLRAVDPYIKPAYAHLWSAAIEHQFSPDLVGAVEYTGSKGVNLYTINRLNIPGSDLVYAGAGTATTRLDPQYSYINFRTNGGFSNYDAMNVRFEMRNLARQGLTLRANYTWSHALDNLSNTFSESAMDQNLGVLDPLHPGLDYGSADYDVRHRVTLAAVWDIPYKGNNAFEKQVLGGWSIIPNFSAHTGTPFTLYDCTNTGFVQCPRAMYDTPFHVQYTNIPTGQPNQFAYFNVGTPDSSYVNPVAQVSDFGPFPATMTGRNVFVGPGVWNFDFAIHKDFAVTERVHLELRGEAFNIFNHSNLYLVYSSSDLSAFYSLANKTGNVVTATRGVNNANNGGTSANPLPENRNLQLAVKLIF